MRTEGSVNFKGGKLWLGDCLEQMQRIPAGAVDMVFADLPYGMIGCEWDSVIPFNSIWPMLARCGGQATPFVMTGTFPFSAFLVASKIDWFRHRWVWDKVSHSCSFQARYKPLNVVEDVLVFSQITPAYNPQKTKTQRRRETQMADNGSGFTTKKSILVKDNNGEACPKNLITFSNADHTNRLHPTQKPVALVEYLIKTYTKPGDVVLDPTCGSGTTAIAAHNTGRRWVCIEKDPAYFEVARQRIVNHLKMPTFGLNK